MVWKIAIQKRASGGWNPCLWPNGITSPVCSIKVLSLTVHGGFFLKGVSVGSSNTSNNGHFNCRYRQYYHRN